MLREAKRQRAIHDLRLAFRDADQDTITAVFDVAWDVWLETDRGEWTTDAFEGYLRSLVNHRCRAAGIGEVPTPVLVRVVSVIVR